MKNICLYEMQSAYKEAHIILSARMRSLLDSLQGRIQKLCLGGGPGVDFNVNVAKFKKYLEKKYIHIHILKKTLEFRGGQGPAAPPPLPEYAPVLRLNVSSV